MSEDSAVDSLLGATARWTAAVRAMESARGDRLFDDPWAATLAGEVGAAWGQAQSADSVLPIVIRTRFFDDFLQRVAIEEGVRQIVLLAAGLDTRAFRLHWPEQCRLFELDRPSVLDYKEQILEAVGAQPACARQLIRVDLTASWTEVLLSAGFDPRQPSVWLLEGFLFYIPNEQTTHIIDEATTLTAPGSWIGFDVVNSAVMTSPLTRRWVDMQAASGAPWIGTMDEPEEFLAARGWRTTLTQAGAPEAHYGRWCFPVIPVKMPDMPHNWLVTGYREPTSRWESTRSAGPGTM
jgi:methyltransferase (TIGR00027 family)